ncbi:MAG: hypothetical protein IJV06_09910 [Bacteroidaceae bacterium]|nr:hypothetical protein [Bacteroidaceae bacterium]
MKKLLVLLMLVVGMGVSVNAQQYTVRKERSHTSSDSTKVVDLKIDTSTRYDIGHSTFPELIAKAGKFQRRSAMWRIGAICTGATGGIVCALSKGKQTPVAVGCSIIAVGGLMELVSINYQFRSGVLLEASAGRIAVSF